MPPAHPPGCPETWLTIFLKSATSDVKAEIAHLDSDATPHAWRRLLNRGDHSWLISPGDHGWLLSPGDHGWGLGTESWPFRVRAIWLLSRSRRGLKLWILLAAPGVCQKTKRTRVFTKTFRGSSPSSGSNIVVLCIIHRTNSCWTGCYSGAPSACFRIHTGWFRCLADAASGSEIKIRRISETGSIDQLRLPLKPADPEDMAPTRRTGGRGE